MTNKAKVENYLNDLINDTINEVTNYPEPDYAVFIEEKIEDYSLKLDPYIKE